MTETTEQTRQTDEPPASSSAAVELVDVHKSFGPVSILRGVDLEVRERETLVIIGRSGQGKSVSLRHIVGLELPDRGEVRVFGKDVAKVEKEDRLALLKRLGFLFQSGALLNWMTLADNVALPLRVHEPGLSDAEIDTRVNERLRLVALEKSREKYPSEISGGMKKRAALARASILEPELLLYDEPTSGLDPVIANTINDLIIRTGQVLKTTQIVVTHDMESAYRIADRIAMLYEGRIHTIGTPDEIRTTDDPIVRQFIEGRTDGPLALES